MRLLSFVILIVPALCFSQIKEELILTDAELGNLKGKIKKVKTYFYDVYYEYDENYENDSLVIKPYSGFIGHAMEEYNFNKEGIILTRNKFKNKNDKFVKTTSAINYYDKNNRLDSIVELSENLKSKRIYNYVGDSIVKITSKVESDKIGETTSISEHRFRNNVEEMSYQYDPHTKYGFFRKHRFVYDEQNRMLRQENFGDTDSIQELTIYMYPNSVTRNPNKGMVFLPYDNLVSTSNLEYEPNGNLIKIEYLNLELKDKEMTKTSSTSNTFDYKFDVYGNWLEKRQFFPSGKLKELVKREIFYFE